MSRSSNLLVLMSDEHQSRAMSCAGHFVKTPNLDRLAASGTRFTNAYTPCPICVPARASFATGLYPHQTGLWDNSMPYTGQIPGWGHALQATGVPVESIGKLHYRSVEDANGFDVQHIPMMLKDGIGPLYMSIRKEQERYPPPNRILGKYVGAGSSKYTEYDASVVSRTLQWLAERGQSKEHVNNPWCLYVGLVAPHFPLVCPDEFYDLYPQSSLPEVKLHPSGGYNRHPWVEKQNAFNDTESKFHDADERLSAMSAYYGLVSWLDHNVGQILTSLAEAGMGDNTTVVYTSDHGDNVGARGLWGKSNMYEESVSVPLIVNSPETNGDVCNTPVSLLDLSEMILDHFGATLEGDRPGRSLYQLMDSHPDEERLVFSEYHATGAVTGAFMLRCGRYKLIHYVNFEPELFDLENDPEELVNLANNQDYENLLQDLSARLESICDTKSTDARAHADQAALVAAYGGAEKAIRETVGPGGGTPPPVLN